MSTRTTTTMTTHACPTTTTPTPPTSPPTMLNTHLAKTLIASAGAFPNSSASNNANDSRPKTNTSTTLLNTIHTQAQSISWRLRQYCNQAITANRRRRRRRRDEPVNNNNSTTNYSSGDCNPDNNNNSNNSNNFVYSTPNNAALTDADHYTRKNNNNSNSYSYRNNKNNNNSSNFSQRSNSNLSKTTTTTASSSVIKLLNAIVETLSRSSKAATYIAALFLLTTLCSVCAASPCDLQSWWDPLKDKCITCTVCEGDLIPLRPCQLHRDTICGSIYDLKIDWVVLAKTEPNWKERRKDDANMGYEQQLTQDELLQLQDESLSMNWQTTALFLAVLACLLFFIVAAGILVHHMRQWRRMERRLDQDVEELSTKLMAKLAEVQSMEGGTFFIGNADTLGIPATFQPQHVLLPEKPAKHHDRRILKPLQPGNVYIEENGSKG